MGKSNEEILKEACEEIENFCPVYEPIIKDECWGNEDDVEYHGYSRACWKLAQIVKKALKEVRGF